MLGKSIGIDLGTKRIKYYRKGDGIIFDEENCIAIENRDEIRAIGDEAAEMVGRTPETIEVIYPVNRGVIANVSARSFFSMLHLTESTVKQKEHQEPTLL